MTQHAYSAANWLAMHCRRHMHMYGTTKEQLGHLAINSRRYAALNPLAIYHNPITMDDYLNARSISEPFGLLDCDVPIDGSIAVVVSSVDYAADTPNPRWVRYRMRNRATKLAMRFTAMPARRTTTGRGSVRSVANTPAGLC